jgi:hypothetical protein
MVLNTVGTCTVYKNSFDGFQGSIYWKVPPPLVGEYQLMSFGGKNTKRPREKGKKVENVEEKGRKGK